MPTFASLIRLAQNISKLNRMTFLLAFAISIRLNRLNYISRWKSEKREMERLEENENGMRMESEKIKNEDHLNLLDTS